MIDEHPEDATERMLSQGGRCTDNVTVADHNDQPLPGMHKGHFGFYATWLFYKEQDENDHKAASLNGQSEGQCEAPGVSRSHSESPSRRRR